MESSLDEKETSVTIETPESNANVLPEGAHSTSHDTNEVSESKLGDYNNSNKTLEELAHQSVADEPAFHHTVCNEETDNPDQPKEQNARNVFSGDEDSEDLPAAVEIPGDGSGSTPGEEESRTVQDSLHDSTSFGNYASETMIGDFNENLEEKGDWADFRTSFYDPASESTVHEPQSTTGCSENPKENNSVSENIEEADTCDNDHECEGENPDNARMVIDNLSPFGQEIKDGKEATTCDKSFKIEEMTNVSESKTPLPCETLGNAIDQENSPLDSQVQDGEEYKHWDFPKLDVITNTAANENPLISKNLENTTIDKGNLSLDSQENQNEQTVTPPELEVATSRSECETPVPSEKLENGNKDQDNLSGDSQEIQDGKEVTSCDNSSLSESENPLPSEEVEDIDQGNPSLDVYEIQEGEEATTDDNYPDLEGMINVSESETPVQTEKLEDVDTDQDNPPLDSLEIHGEEAITADNYRDLEFARNVSESKTHVPSEKLEDVDTYQDGPPLDSQVIQEGEKVTTDDTYPDLEGAIHVSKSKTPMPSEKVEDVDTDQDIPPLESQEIGNSAEAANCENVPESDYLTNVSKSEAPLPSEHFPELDDVSIVSESPPIANLEALNIDPDTPVDSQETHDVEVTSHENFRKLDGSTDVLDSGILTSSKKLEDVSIGQEVHIKESQSGEEASTFDNPRLEEITDVSDRETSAASELLEDVHMDQDSLSLETETKQEALGNGVADILEHISGSEPPVESEKSLEIDESINLGPKPLKNDDDHIETTVKSVDGEQERNLEELGTTLVNSDTQLEQDSADAPEPKETLSEIETEEILVRDEKENESEHEGQEGRCDVVSDIRNFHEPTDGGSSNVSADGEEEPFTIIESDAEGCDLSVNENSVFEGADDFIVPASKTAFGVDSEVKQNLSERQNQEENVLLETLYTDIVEAIRSGGAETHEILDSTKESGLSDSTSISALDVQGQENVHHVGDEERDEKKNEYSPLLSAQGMAGQENKGFLGDQSNVDILASTDVLEDVGTEEFLKERNTPVDRAVATNFQGGSNFEEVGTKEVQEQHSQLQNVKDFSNVPELEINTSTPERNGIRDIDHCSGIFLSSISDTRERSVDEPVNFEHVLNTGDSQKHGKTGHDYEKEVIAHTLGLLEETEEVLSQSDKDFHAVETIEDKQLQSANAANSEDSPCPVSTSQPLRSLSSISLSAGIAELDASSVETHLEKVNSYLEAVNGDTQISEDYLSVPLSTHDGDISSWVSVASGSSENLQGVPGVEEQASKSTDVEFAINRLISEQNIMTSAVSGHAKSHELEISEEGMPNFPFSVVLWCSQSISSFFSGFK